MWRLRLSLLLNGLEHKWQMCFSLAWRLKCRVKWHFWPKNTLHSLQSAISYVNNDLGTHNMYGDTNTKRQVVQCDPSDFLRKNVLAYSSHLIYSKGRVHFLIGVPGRWLRVMNSLWNACKSSSLTSLPKWFPPFIEHVTSHMRIFVFFTTYLMLPKDLLSSYCYFRLVFIMLFLTRCWWSLLLPYIIVIWFTLMFTLRFGKTCLYEGWLVSPQFHFVHSGEAPVTFWTV